MAASKTPAFNPDDEIVPGGLLQNLVHPNPARLREARTALEEVQRERRLEELSRLQPLPSFNPRQGLSDPSVRGWNWGAFLASPFWAFAHGFTALGVGLLLTCWLFPLPNWIMGRHGGNMAYRKRHFESMEEFQSVQRRWAMGGLFILLGEIGLVVWFLVNFL